LGAVLDDHWRRSAEATAIAQSRNESWYRMGFLGLGMLSSLTLLLWDRFDSNRSRLSDAASVLKLAGALVQQTVLVYAGQESGRRARDYFAYTREPMIGNNAEHADRSADHKKMIAAGKGRGTRPLPKMRRSSSRSVVAWGLFACGALLIGAAVLRNKENSQ
jgi:hypothetical protein